MDCYIDQFRLGLSGGQVGGQAGGKFVGQLGCGALVVPVLSATDSRLYFNAMSETDTTQSVLQLALYRVLKALAKVAMHYGMSVTAVSELLRRAYVDAAEEALGVDGKKIKSSSICALTGLYRKEVVRIQALPPVDAATVDDRYNRSARVISGWTRDESFCTKAGRPAVLSFDGENSFSELVRKYSGDMTPTAMLTELRRLGSIEITKSESIKLTNTAFIPQESDLDTLQILGTDTADLIDTIQYNMDKPAEQRRFQRKVGYLHIPEQNVEEFRVYASKESQKLLEKLDGWLSKRDTEDIAEGKPGSRIGLGIFQFSQSRATPGSVENVSGKVGSQNNKRASHAKVKE